MTMTRNAIGMALAVVAAATLLGQPAALQAQTPSGSLGTVRLGRSVVADGKVLPAGSYTLRVAAEAVTPVVGQGPDSEKWIEFLQGGQVKGRELSSVIAATDVKAAVNENPPAPNSSKVELLKGGEYLRVWVNRGGYQYLIHLMVNQ
jgi:hypothetical protein